MFTSFKFYILFCGLLTAFLTSFFANAQISSPEDVNNLVFWVDANDVNGTGIQPTDGSVVTTWVDKSGGNNLTTTAGTVTFQAAGFDGINPGLRFPLEADMDASNPFSGNVQDEITVFFVSANVTLTRNFALSLNGHNTGNNSTDGRFSFHAPWISGDVFFDASGCCGATRLDDTFPNDPTETTLYTGLNDANGNSQALRIDGQAFLSDMSAIPANVSRGIHVGDLPNDRSYDGRFAEIVIYDRALTTAEIANVECYLLLKWKSSAAPSGCSVNISAHKDVQLWDPAAEGLYAIPGNDVLYTITVVHVSGPALDTETLFLEDSIPSELIFFNGDIDGAGPETNPISFTNNGSGLTFDYVTDVAFSNLAAKPTAMTDCIYTPMTGYDPAVTYVCVQPTGAFQPGTPNPSFSVSFRARIQ